MSSVPQGRPPRGEHSLTKNPSKASGPSVVESMEPRILLTGVNFFAPPVGYPLLGSQVFPVSVQTLNGNTLNPPSDVLASYATNASGGGSTGNIQVLLANSDGTLNTSATPTQLTNIHLITLQTVAVRQPDGTLATLNGDGLPDVVALEIGPSGNAAMQVLLGTASTSPTPYSAQTFSYGQYVSFGTAVANQPTTLTTAQFNNDGVFDVALGYFYKNSVSVMIGNGDGSVAAPTQQYAVGRGPDAITAADLNGDGFPDLVVANKLDDTVSVLMRLPAGGFQAQKVYAVGNDPTSVTVADLSGDGVPDIITTNSQDKTISILLGNGDGTFKPAETYRVGLNPVAVAVGDFNGDGKTDLAIADAGANAICFLPGNGDGTFQHKEKLFLGNNSPASLAVGDFNGDGRTDLVVQATSASTVNSNGVYAAKEIVLLNNNRNQPGFELSNGVLNITGTDGNDTINLSQGEGTLVAIQVNATTNSFSLSQVGAINVHGLGGDDSITIGGGLPAVFVGGAAGNDTVVLQNSYGDTVFGGNGNDSIDATASSGNNSLVGGKGNDTLLAGVGNDTMMGTRGDDSLIGGPGNDLLFGNAGNDTILGSLITDNGIDSIYGGTGNDSISNFNSGDKIFPGTGSDTVIQ